MSNEEKGKLIQKMLIYSEDYFECQRCKINSLDSPNRIMPCPRGGCEAYKKGTVTVNKTLNL